MKHITVTFVLEQVTSLHFGGFECPNVILDLDLKKVGEGYELVMDDCYGVAGTITASRVRLGLQPGVPEGSQYAKL